LFVAKCLIFSQYISTLDWLQEALPLHGFGYRTLSGGMSMAKRAKALRDFQDDPSTTVFLLSLRAGAVGINLTQANSVFIFEPSFNPAVELQAVGRVYRLGQTRPVEIVRLIIEDSVESRMRQMLENKYGPSDAASSVSADDGDDDKKPAAKPAAAVDSLVVGSISADKATVLKEEYDLLFGVDAAGTTIINNDSSNQNVNPNATGSSIIDTALI